MRGPIVSTKTMLSHLDQVIRIVSSFDSTLHITEYLMHLEMLKGVKHCHRMELNPREIISLNRYSTAAKEIRFTSETSYEDCLAAKQLPALVLT